MKASIRVTKEKLIERVRAVQARDLAVYEQRKAETLVRAEEQRLLTIKEHLDKVDKWKAMTPEEFANSDGGYNRNCRLPNAPDHEYVIRGLEMATDDTLTLNLDSDLAKYLR